VPDPTGDADQALAPVVTVVVSAVLTVLLSVWAAFYSPLRAGTVPLPVSLLALAGLLRLGVLAGRAVGWPAAALLALLWTAVTLPLSVPRREGDLVVQGLYGTGLVGTLYLLGGIVGWVVVVGAAAGRGAGARPGWTPAAPAGRVPAPPH
jgi:hypothetical protein